ncbi:MAG TPA: type II toxin-antitoxin system RelE/ParE family toxin [Pirellulales bacterium]|nr:type II toxin-antitoxin system RelE/ParE family toxin [Pirellulales bacterium]
MKRFVVSLLAEADLAEIHAYIAADRPRAADRLIARFFRAFGTLATQPQMGERRDELLPGLRTFSVKSYVVCYAAIDDGIEVARVLHGARDIAAIFRGP